MRCGNSSAWMARRATAWAGQAFVLCALWLGAAPTMAQAPADGEILGILGKSSLGDEDLPKVRGFVEQRLASIVSGNGSSKAAGELRDGFMAASPAGKQALAGLCVELFTPAVRQADLAPAAQLLSLLNSMNDERSARLLIELLKDERPALRTAAALGLRGIHRILAQAGDARMNEMIEALRAAGKAETSAAALRATYQALAAPGGGDPPADPRPIIAALLDILESRATFYDKGEVKAEAADTVGISLAGGLIRNAADAERDRFIVVCARVLRHAVATYTAELIETNDKTGSPMQIQLRNEMELLIAESERQLVALLKPQNLPEVAKAMLEQQEADKKFAMKEAMNKWADLLRNSHNIDVRLPD